jgi:hypothetical protein
MRVYMYVNVCGRSLDELGRKSKEEGGTGRWSDVVENTTGVGAKTIVGGVDGTGTAVFQRDSEPRQDSVVAIGGTATAAAAKL